MKFSKKVIFFTLVAVCGLIGIFVFQYLKFNDGNIHIVFCNVGQGDGIFIRTKEGKNIIIDGGPNDSILSCISNHMPFWDRTIHLMLLTHPHEDHLQGLLYVLQRYNAIHFGTEKLANNTYGFEKVMETVMKKQISLKYLYKGDSIRFSDKLTFSVIAPTASYLSKTSPNSIIGETSEFASLELLLSYLNFNILFTGDSQKEQLWEASTKKSISVDILQIPHHGSKTGISKEIIKTLRPRLCIISVGKNNRYHHPTQEVLSILKDQGCKILRTDINGEIEIVSNGKSFWTKVSH